MYSEVALDDFSEHPSKTSKPNAALDGATSTEDGDVQNTSTCIDYAV